MTLGECRRLHRPSSFRGLIRTPSRPRRPRGNPRSLRGASRSRPTKSHRHRLLSRKWRRKSPKQKEEASELDADLAKVPEPEIALPDLPKKPEVKPEEEQREETDAESQPQAPSEAHLESAPTSTDLCTPRRSCCRPRDEPECRRTGCRSRRNGHPAGDACGSRAAVQTISGTSHRTPLARHHPGSLHH